MNKQFRVNDLVQKCQQWLAPEKYSDYCVNGLQVANSGRPCRHIATAVTACYDAIYQAAMLDADTLIVHHGLFWRGDNLELTGINYNRAQLLIKHDIALLAYHLPLDDHAEYGNNVQLGMHLGIPANCQYNLGSLGCVADYEITLDDLASRLGSIMLQPAKCFNFGPDNIKKIAWCTGAAQDLIIRANEVGADTYISGEVSERTYHYAKELGMNYLYVGHHASERFGVQALAKSLVKEFELEHTYVEIFNPV